ncbi:alpha/beta hydrolase-fold protein [Halosolutus amylolyticus]|uniref:Alpha/beta hydrolase-fold protein n=1 Tax=Halosolutus amylolyticus TaxID=2932267 RepID=A0ABD5PVX9_9EURY|nr:alpha/beta hydrolase-fold protein [Halosolutus amylolyticus]
MGGELEWRPYDLANDHTVVGDVRVSEPIPAPECHADRHLLAYLPPSYEASDDDYPVLYMHDGQNLFDEVTSHSGEWRADETMERLAAEGREAIIVGIPIASGSRAS